MIESNLPLMTKNITCAVTGHRVIGEDFDKEKLKTDLTDVIKKGYSIFMTGMAQGFDLLCFETLLILKKEFPFIKICAVIPCAEQSKYYSLEDKERYAYCLEQADYIAREDRTYFKGCMLLRNDYLIENCSLLYAYFNGQKRGGTYYTLLRAKKHAVCVKYYEEEL